MFTWCHDFTHNMLGNSFFLVLATNSKRVVTWIGLRFASVGSTLNLLRIWWKKSKLPAANYDLLPNFSIDLRTAQVAWKDKEGQGEEAGVAYLNYDNNVNCWFLPTTSLESTSFTLKVIAEDKENEEADCGSKLMVGGKGNPMLST